MRPFAPQCSSLVVVAVSLLTSSCGGGGGGGQTPTPGPVATGTPAPTPSPSPTANPTPTPAPPPFGLATVGQSLNGFIACQSGSFTRDAQQRMTGVTSLTNELAAQRTFRLDYLADDTFGVTVGGAAGPRFEPQEKAPPRIAAYDYYKEGDNTEFELYRPTSVKLLKYSAIGRYSGDSLCFFAAGGPGPFTSRPAPTGFIVFQGLADGMALIKGTAYRVFESPVDVTLSYENTGMVQLSLRLRGRQPVFDDASASPLTDLGTFTGKSDQISAAGEGKIFLTGNGGYGGFALFNVSDSDPKPKSITFVYSLRNPLNGDQIFGSAAVEKP